MKKLLSILALCLCLSACAPQAATTSYNQNELELNDTQIEPTAKVSENWTIWDKTATKQYREELEGGRYRYCTAFVGYSQPRDSRPVIESTSLDCSEVFESDGVPVSEQ